MEPRFQTSFIPKKPVVASQMAPVSIGGNATNVVSLASTVIFIVVLIVSGALFFYKSVLSADLLEADQAVNDARSAFQLDKIQELIDSNSRMMSINNLLNNHVAVSGLLKFLQEVTVKKVRFDELMYKNQGGAPSLTMKVEAGSYNALATQGDIFAKSDFIKSPYFSEFSPTENGLIRANFSSDLDPTLVSYKKMIESMQTSGTSELSENPPIIP